MKTRIRITTLKDNTKKYHCEIKRTNWFLVIILSIFIIGISYYSLITHKDIIFTLILSILCTLVLILEYYSYDDLYNIFDIKSVNNIHNNLEDAKKAIDEYILDKEKENRITINKKVKSTKYLKYP